MSTPEAKVKAKLKKFLDSDPDKFWYYCPVSVGYGKHGVPDFLIAVRSDGRTLFLAIETKANGNKPTPLQLREIDKLRRVGAVVWVVDEVSIDECVTLLKAF